MVVMDKQCINSAAGTEFLDITEVDCKIQRGLGPYKND
jgi:hypothetical protein